MVDLMPKYRLGTVSPRGGVTDIQPYQFYRIVPRDVMLVSVPLGLRDYTRELCEEALKNYWTCADQLAAKGVHRIVQMGVPISSLMGREYVLNLIAQTQRRYGIPGDADLEGVISGMHHLGVRTVALGSRWPDAINDALTAYLEAAGIRVVGRTTRGQMAAQAFGMTLEEGMNLALELGREALRLAPQADGVFLPGGAWLSVHAVPILEEELGKPFFVNLTGLIWSALRQPGVVPPIQGWGRLLAN